MNNVRAHLRVVNRRFITVALVISGFIAIVAAAPTSEVQPAAVLAAEEPQRTLKVAAIGDSITYGSGLTDEERKEKAYPAQLQKMLGGGYEVKNFGVNGRAVIHTSNHPYRDEAAYTESKDYQPDIVLIMLGTNDSKKVNWIPQSYKNDLTTLVEAYKALDSNPTVYLMTEPMIVVAPTNSDKDIDGQVVIDQVVPMIRQVAKATDTQLIDVFDATKDRTDTLPDGVHPNAEGLEIIARTVYEAIR